MGSEFSPQERIQNILYVLDQLQARLHDTISSDFDQKTLWSAAIQLHLTHLDKAVQDMGTSPPSV